MSESSVDRVQRAVEFVESVFGDRAVHGRRLCTHALSVANAFTSTHLQLVALLHDVVEDSDVTLQGVSNLFGEDVAEAVDALTRREDETYRQYLSRVSAHGVARLVKVADLRDNLSTCRRPSLRCRYLRALATLTDPNL